MGDVKVQQQRTIVVGTVPYRYTMRRSRRAKHILLHVDLGGAIEVVVPWRVPYYAAERFVQDETVWLERALIKNSQLRAAAPRRLLVSGENLPVLGDQVRLQVVVDRARRRSRYRVRQPEGVIEVLVSDQRLVRSTLARWYIKEAERYFLNQSRRMAAQLGVQVKTVVVSSAQSQWGSCIQKRQRISLQWRLLLAPRAVADYVIAHEVAHLKERRHTERFWRLVEQLDPHYAEHRRWLRKKGYALVL